MTQFPFCRGLNTTRTLFVLALFAGGCGSGAGTSSSSSGGHGGSTGAGGTASPAGGTNGSGGFTASSGGAPFGVDAAANSDATTGVGTGGIGASGGTSGSDAGAAATGGASGGNGTGGGAGRGGMDGTGGRVGTGGMIGTGGRMGTGGMIGTGGRVGTGGMIGTGGRVGTGGNTGTGGAAGTDAGVDAATDVTVCTDECAAGTARCVTGGRQACITSGSCRVWGAVTACGQRQTCQGSATAGACVCQAAPAGCATAGSVCTNGGVRTCAVDTNACVYEQSATVCQSPKMCTGAFPGAACTCPATASNCDANVFCTSTGRARFEASVPSGTIGTSVDLSWRATTSSVPADSRDALYVGFYDLATTKGMILKFQRLMLATVTNGTVAAGNLSVVGFTRTGTTGLWGSATVPPAIVSAARIDAVCGTADPVICDSWTIRARIPLGATGVSVTSPYMMWTEVKVYASGSPTLTKWPLAVATVDESADPLMFPEPLGSTTPVSASWATVTVNPGSCTGGFDVGP